MELNEYQSRAMETCELVKSCDNIAYMSYGLMGEVGEFMEKIAKHIRKGTISMHNNEAKISEDFTLNDHDALISELGDIAWFVAGMARVLGCDLETVCRKNLSKTTDRMIHNVIIGDGDNR